MIIFLTLFTLAFAECVSGRCSSCLVNSKMLQSYANATDGRPVEQSSAFGITCRWCPKSNRCYPFGDLYNTCSSSQEIKHESDCPVDPPRTTNYSEDTAVIMMQYASAVYLLDFHANKTFQPGYKVLANLSFPLPKKQTGHVLLGVLPSHNHIAIAIDGTQNIDELFEEIENVTMHDFMPDELPGAKVVGYFLAGLVSALKVVHDDLHSAVSTYPDYDIWVTGHSLGGSIAALLSISLGITLNMTDRIKIYTFGEPRVGNQAFAEAFDERIKDAYRIVNNRDLIAHIPPCNINPASTKCEGWGYHHGTEIWYAEGDYTNKNMCWYRECTADPFGEDDTCSNQFSRFSLDDHYGYWDVLFCGGWCGTWKDSVPDKSMCQNISKATESLIFNQTKYEELRNSSKLRI